MQAWSKPEVTDIRIECTEDMLQGCWSPSAPEPFAFECAFPQTCPETGD